MHDVTADHWHEPADEFRRVGTGKFVRPPRPYDVFMEEQGIPVYRDFGIRKVQDLALQPWSRMGGRGAFIQLFGTEGLWGSYLVEVPARGALKVEKHMYEEQFLVVEGRGTTEVWQEEGGRKHVFEWQRGSFFAIPLNAYHTIINASSSPALLLAGTTAPNAMNLYANNDFIFNNSYAFRDRFDDRNDYFKENKDIVPDPLIGRAMRRSNFIPDIINCDLPLDNRRSPGYRRIEPFLAGNQFYQFIGQHETGRYSKGHAHAPVAVLICLQGKGYTYTWPASLGTRPFSDGHRDKVVRVDYEPIGMVSAAPMSGDWFHQHFGVSKEPLRLTAWFGPNATYGGIITLAGRPGTAETDEGSNDISEGGKSIPYDEEDPEIREEFEAALRDVGVKSRMEDWLYQKPKEGTARPSTDFIGKHG
jgi:mannose-6-phosphate isomerase-like protein (cupin superfamily)